MRTGVLLFVLGVLIAAVLLQDFPLLGIPSTRGRNPAVTAAMIVAVLAVMTLLLSATHLLGELF